MSQKKKNHLKFYHSEITINSFFFVYPISLFGMLIDAFRIHLYILQNEIICIDRLVICFLINNISQTFSM